MLDTKFEMSSTVLENNNNNSSSDNNTNNGIRKVGASYRRTATTRSTAAVTSAGTRINSNNSLKRPVSFHRQRSLGGNAGATIGKRSLSTLNSTSKNRILQVPQKSTTETTDNNTRTTSLHQSQQQRDRNQSFDGNQPKSSTTTSYNVNNTFQFYSSSPETNIIHVAATAAAATEGGDFCIRNNRNRGNCGGNNSGSSSSSGYKNGDFTSGILYDIHCTDKSYCHSYCPSHPSILVIGTATSLDFYVTSNMTSSCNATTTSIPFTTTTLIYSVPHLSMISSIVWIEYPTSISSHSTATATSRTTETGEYNYIHKKKDHPSESYRCQLPLYLAASDLDGGIYLYHVNVDILEIQGPTLLFYSGNHCTKRRTKNAQIRSLSYEFYNCPETLNLLLVLVAGDKAGILTFVTFLMVSCSSSLFDNCEEHYPQYLHTQQYHIRPRNQQQQHLIGYISKECNSTYDASIFGILGVTFHRERKIMALCTSDGLVQVYSFDHVMMMILLNSRNKDNNCEVQLMNTNVAGLLLWSKQNIGNTPIRSILFDPINDTLLYGGYDKTITIVTITNHQWTLLRELHVHGTVNTIQHDSKYRYIGVGCRDKTFTIFDTSTFIAIKTFYTPSWVTCISWTDSNIVAIRSEPKFISVINFTTIQSTKFQGMATTLPRNVDEYASISWSLCGQFLACCSGSNIVIVDTRQVNCVQHKFHEIASYSTSGSAAVKAVFCPEPTKSNLLAFIDDAGWLVVLLLNTSAMKFELVSERLVEANMKALAWSPDGDVLVCGGKKKLLHVYTSDELEQKIEPIVFQGRIWDIDFVPSTVGSKSMYFGIALGDYTTVIMDHNMEPVLQISRALTCRCLKFHPFSPIVAIGDGAGDVVVIDCDDGEELTEIQLGNRVTALSFSPTGDFLVVGTDACQLAMFETKNYRRVQEFPSDSRPLSITFATNGFYLSVGTLDNLYKLIQLGPLLGPEFIPLNLDGGLSYLPETTINQVLFHSVDGPSLLQRHMMRGGQDNLQRVAAILQDYPTAIYTMDRTTGEGCFDSVMRLKKPGLLKLFVTSLVDGTLNPTNEKEKTVLTTSISLRGRDAIHEIVKSYPADFIIDILNAMTFMKVPFAYPRHVESGDRTECGSSTHHDPWPSDLQYGLSHLEKSGKSPGGLSFSSGSIRTPAILPIPGLGSMSFLSCLLASAPAEVFDNDAMALVLRVLWENYIRQYYYLDFCVFITYYLCWIALVELATQTSPLTIIQVSFKGISVFTILVPVVMLQNTLFAVKEIIEGLYGTKSLYWRSLWNICDWFGIVCVYSYTTSLLLTGNHLIPLAVATTLALTMKVLSYLRGFSSTGWLLSVLSANFQDVQGFLVIVTTILIGFSVAFRLLFAETGDEMYGSLRRSLLSTFELTLMGAYDTSILFETKYTVITIITFIMAVTCIVVVVLNALISILSDSYAKVQEHAVANRRREIASLIVEYMSLLPRWVCQRIEFETTWFHTLLEVDADGSLQVHSEDWEGGLNALRHDIEDMGRLYQQNHERSIERLKTDLDTDITKFKKEVISLLEDLNEDVKYLRKMQSQNILNFDGHHIKKAVRAVKSAGRKSGVSIFKSD